MSERGEAIGKDPMHNATHAYQAENKKNEPGSAPSGYKWTEVGMIPQDWQLGTIESVTPERSRYAIVDGPFGSNLKRIHYRVSGIPIISSGFVTEGVFKAKEYIYVDTEKFEEEKRSAVSAGDIVMAKIGVRCGASAILPQWHETGILSGNALKITVDESRHSTCFIWQVLWNRYATGSIDSWKSVGAQPAISMPNLKKQLLPLPSLQEQRAIATALSDADALIESLGRLTAKKRAIKQAAMQQLLTGQTRLPGFDGEWNIKCLGEMASFHKGHGLPKSDLTKDGATQCIHYGELFTEYGEEITDIISRTSSDSASCRAIRNDVLMPTSDVTPNGLATASAVALPEVVVGGDVLIIRVSERILHGTFLAYVIRMNRAQIMQLVSGTTVFHIYGRDMANFVFDMPPLAEQTEIVAVLSDMESEIQVLERRRDKTKDIKQGMMQQLLTGRVRLVEPDIAA